MSDSYPTIEETLVETVRLFEEFSCGFIVPAQEVVDSNNVVGNWMFWIVFGKQIAQVVEICKVLSLQKASTIDRKVI